MKGSRVVQVQSGVALWLGICAQEKVCHRNRRKDLSLASHQASVSHSHPLGVAVSAKS